MDNNLTISTLVFKHVFSDKDGSLRREVSRGINLPTEMSIRRQKYVDSVTKVPGTRTSLRFDKTVAGTDGKPVKVFANLVVGVPEDAEVTSTDVNDVIGHINCILDGTSPNLALGDEIFVTGEQ